MSLSRTLDKLLAVARRDLLTVIRHRSGFLIVGGGALAEVAAFYYLARAVGPQYRPEGVEYFSFLLVGTGFYTFLVMGINSFLVIVQEAQQTGTLEVLMTTSTPPPMLVVLSAMSAFAGNMMQLVFYLGAGLLVFRAPFGHVNVPGCVVVLTLSLTVAVGLGILAAALQIAIQKGSMLVWVLGSGAWFMTGTLFPVASLPKPLQILAGMIPITHSLAGMRLALLQGADFSALAQPIKMLALFTVILVPFSLTVFSYTLRRARLQGTLSFY